MHAAIVPCPICLRFYYPCGQKELVVVYEVYTTMIIIVKINRLGENGHLC